MPLTRYSSPDGVRVVRPCFICGKEVSVVPYAAAHGQGKFCSKVCLGKWKSTQTGENATHWKGRQQEVVCQHCGNAFVAKSSVVERGGAKYCSRLCATTKQPRRQRKSTTKRSCIVCGRVTEHFTWAVEHSNEGKFCSRECMGKWRSTQTGENAANWRGGLSKIEYPTEWNEKLRRAIRERDGNKCQICGKEAVRLSVHHIDYEKHHLDERNLVSLCVPCHTKTNREREYWQLWFGGAYPLCQTGGAH
jgi:hypothetical protein